MSSSDLILHYAQAQQKQLDQLALDYARRPHLERRPRRFFKRQPRVERSSGGRGILLEWLHGSPVRGS